MPSSDYGNAVGGGLKLKGVKDSGVKKHKKRKAKTESAEQQLIAHSGEAEEITTTQKALAEGEADQKDDVVERREAEVTEYGKTEAQRRHEERRKKRVCLRA